MNPSRKFFLLLAALLTVATTALSQSGQLTVIKAGRLIDPETGTAADIFAPVPRNPRY